MTVIKNKFGGLEIVTNKNNACYIFRKDEYECELSGGVFDIIFNSARFYLEVGDLVRLFWHRKGKETMRLSGVIKSDTKRGMKKCECFKIDIDHSRP